MADRIVTAALVVIGNEILSGRTKDKNIGFIAEYATALGIDLREVRVVPDVEAEIVAAINALRPRYDHVFTTGGIGPTHDDITADAIAVAFGVSIDVDRRAVEVMEARYGRGRLTGNRLRMARIPAGAELIDNPLTGAPGFTIGNVHVMAGVPSIMQAMMDALAPRLSTGRRMLSTTVAAGMGESRYADGLAEIQLAYPDVLIGSYPTFDNSGFTANIVLRCRDAERLEAATAAVEALLATIRAATP